MLPFEWQPITGCSPASPGCANCYAMKLAGEALAAHPSRAGLTLTGRAGPVWSGELRFNAGWLEEPCRLVERRLVVVCPHGDLFHEAAPTGWVDQVFDVMEREPRHVFQILTKRAERMRDYVAGRYAGGPAPVHIAFGVSVERQVEAEQRVRALRATPVPIRYITVYPLLEKISLAAHLHGGWLLGVSAGEEPERPADAAWFAALARECETAAVAFARGDRLGGREAQDDVA